MRGKFHLHHAAMSAMGDLTYEGRDLEVLADMPNYYAWIMDRFGPHVRGRVIEYGSGTGTVSARLLPLADTLTLVEPSPNLVASLRTRFAGQPRAETIVMVNVLEHVEDDEDALSNLLRALTPGGKLLIFVPALQFLMSRLDLLHGHFRRYHRPDLVGKVSRAGGQVEICRYFDLPGVAPWLVLNKLMGSTTFNPALVRFNDRAMVPLARKMEEYLNPPFGKNLILVARRS
jgi:SAM-dependent methyltransferase